jgi:AraC-like DNA-binding protein
MFYLTREPLPPLSLYVSQLWYGENSPSHQREVLLPTGEFDLVVNTRDGVLRIYRPESLMRPEIYTGPLVSGAHTRPYVIDTAQQVSLAGAKFRPGGAFALFGLPVDALRDRHIPLADLWGSAAHRLQEEMAAPVSPDARLRILQGALTDRLRHARRPHRAVTHALARFHHRQGLVPVSAIASELEISSRRFLDLFRREVGLPPKLYCRLLRFRRSLHGIERSGNADLTDIAYDCGYYDQSHMIREFRELSGFTPSAYLQAAGRYDNQVPLTRS